MATPGRKGATPVAPQVFPVGSQEHIPAPGAPIAAGAFSATMFPGLKVEKPRLEALPGEVIIGYETTQADTGCFKCDTLNTVGWVFVILWCIFFFPIAFMMCLFPSFHEIVQRPVYGTPGSAPKMAHTAVAGMV